MPAKNLFTISQAAHYLKVSEKTLRRWEKKNLLIPIRTIGLHRRYSLSQLKNVKSSIGKFSLSKYIDIEKVIDHDSARSKDKSYANLQNKSIQSEASADSVIASERSYLEIVKQIYKFTPFKIKNVVLYSFVLLILLSSLNLFLNSGNLKVAILDSKVYKQITNKLSLNRSAPNPFEENQSIRGLKKQIEDSEEIKRVLAATSFDNVNFNVNVESNFAEKSSFEGEVAANGGLISTSSTSFDFVNREVSVLNIGGAATDINIGANTGTTTIANVIEAGGNTITSPADLLIDPGGGGVSVGTNTPGNVDLANDDFFISGDLEIDGISYIPTLNINGDQITDITGTGLLVSGGALQTTLGTSIESSEISDSTIAETDLNASNTPSNTQILSYNSSTGGFTWIASASDLWTDNGTITYLTNTTDDLAFGGTTSSASFFFDVSTGDLTITGDLAVNGDTITADGATLTINAGGSVDIQDSLTVDSLTTDTGGVTIVSGQDLTIGTIGLNDNTGGAGSSGASLVGVFPEFANSASTNVQDVLDDLDAAISGSATGDITAVGDILTGAAFTETDGDDGNSIWFEGTTNDANELELTAADPSDDTITVTLPAITGTLASLAGTQIFTGAKTFNDLTVADTDISFSGESTTFTVTGAFTLNPGGTLTLVDGGDALAIDSSEFDVSGTTGAITIDDGGNAGQVSVEGTILDIDSLTFVGSGTLTSTSADLALTTATSGDITLNPAGAGQVEFADGDFLNIGGAVDQTTNTISNVAGIDINFATDDNDLYIQGILEVDGTIYQAGNQVCDTSG